MRELSIGFNAIGRPLQLYKDERKSHHHVIGASGSGKSKFLEQMMRADLRAGQGFCLIDPHGTLYADVLKYCAYRVLNREIILLDLSQPEQIVGFNFFTKETGDTSVQVDNLINATLHAWDAKNTDATPTLERVLKLIYTTLIDADLTLPQVSLLLDFSAKEIRNELIDQIENDLIRREWQELSNLTKARDFRDEILSAKNRLFRFLTSKTLMRFLGVEGKTVDLFEAMNEQKIVLVNLARSDNLSGENARVFGSLLVNQFFQAALKRKKDAAGRDPQPYYLYLDEFQNFVSLDLCNMLDEVRKFGLFLILSHQRFGQLNEDIEDAVLTNCRIKTVFGGLRTDDARRMAEELFIGKLDPKKIKVAIYQLKHWYKYTRDKVYSQSKSYSESSGKSHGTGSGSVSGSSNASLSGQTLLPPSDQFFTGAMWHNDSNITALSESKTEAFSRSDSESSFTGESSSESWSETQGVTDVPVFAPVPFQELSSLQYYTPEEQLLELTQALKLQQQRHCFIQLPDKETEPLLVPFVEEFYISQKNLKWYINQQMAKAEALSADEADLKIFQARENLLKLKNPASEVSESGEDELSTKSDPQNKPRRTIFDKIKEANPDLDI